MLNIALGKAHEDIERYEKAFKFYETGNNLYKKNISYNLKDEIHNFEKIKNFFKFNSIDSLDDYGQKIIFVLGMPRSGTTLTEQILSSHKNVYGAGELDFLEKLMRINFFKDDQFKFLNLSVFNLNIKLLLLEALE